jgi:hypothetical protein
MARNNTNHPKRGRFVALMTRVLRDAGVRGAIRPVGDGFTLRIEGDGPGATHCVIDLRSMFEEFGRASPLRREGVVRRHAAAFVEAPLAMPETFATVRERLTYRVTTPCRAQRE